MMSLYYFQTRKLLRRLNRVKKKPTINEGRSIGPNSLNWSISLKVIDIDKDSRTELILL
jgi:hypothetical protein